MKVKVLIHAAKQATIIKGHPWIFPKAIAKIIGKPVNGELVHIGTEAGETLGIGVYNEHSLYRVRVLARANEENIMAAASFTTLIRERLRQAKLVRECIGLPNEHTNAYRFFNSEGDGLSGLTIDRFHHVFVVASSAYWVELHRETITHELAMLFPQDQILWRPQAKPLRQDGWDSSEEQVAAVDDINVLEAGVTYQVGFRQSQKTGLFLDQRENHQRIAAIASGKKVLDLYTYTGGFALHAAKAGASKVTAVDSSAQAIIQGRQNAHLNNLPDIQFIEADARDFLVQAGEYDIVVLDPPKLVPSQQHIQKAKNYYRFLHREVFKHMQSGSLLMTCNCSSALSTAEFTALASSQAQAVGKQVRILGIYGPASCHPVLAAFPEGNYLTAVLLAVI